AVYRTEALRLADAFAGAGAPAGALSAALRRLDHDGASHADWSDAIERALDPLDQQAARCIQKEAVNTGLAAAFSPYGFLDAAIVLWRNAVLVRSIARVYQSRAGLAGSLSIARHVVVAIALADLTQEASTALFGGFRGLASLISPAGQGLASAALTVRVGLVAQRHCRPLPMPKDKEQGLIALLSQSAIEAVRSQVRARRKPASERSL
ncbi:MAG TPA: YcjF family protein, partial [Candidatus Brocadiia bacterium]|nr:YcjF family protein [Candidatus Brocadiia bacterium]